MAAAAATIAVGVPGHGAAQSWRTVTMSRQLEGAGGDVRVNVEYGAGRFRLGSTEERLLYSMELRYDEDRFEPVASYSGNRLRLGVESLGHDIDIRDGDDTGELDLRLARGVPLALDLEFGAVRADLDLGGLSMTSLDVSTGASESILDISEPNPLALGTARFEVGAAEFTARNLGNLNAERLVFEAGVGSVTLGLDGRWRRDARMSIKMGLGSLELRVPEGLGVELRKDSFLTSLDANGFVRRDGVYYSEGWEGAERKITIELEAAFGRVEVVWIR
jgi:hypothetical protein